MEFEFSIVIPLYNKEKYIAKTLQSVLQQTFQGFEVIVVDDYSQDNSIGEVKKINDSRIRIISHSINLGLSASRNTGIDASKHNYIAFLDADDLWDDTFLDSMAKLIKSYPNEKVFAAHYREKYGDKTFVPNLNLPKNTYKNQILIDDFFKNNIGRLIITQSGLVVHKEVFLRVGYYDPNVTFAEDIDFYIRCFKSFSLAYLYTPLHSRVVISGSMAHGLTSSKRHPNLDKYLHISENLDKFIYFNYYCMYRRMKNERALSEMRHYRKKLKLETLSFIQILFIITPIPLYHLLISFKRFLLQKGVHISSY